MINYLFILAAGLQSTFAATPYQGLAVNHYPKFNFQKDLGSFAVSVSVVIREVPNTASIGGADLYIAVKTPVLDENGEKIIVGRKCEGEKFLHEYYGEGEIDLIFPAEYTQASCTSGFLDEINGLMPNIFPYDAIVLTYFPSDRSLNTWIGVSVKMALAGFASY